MKKLVSFFLAAWMVLCGAAVTAPTVNAEVMLTGENLSLTVDSREPVTVKALTVSYDNNLLLSLRDLGAALADTPKAFSLVFDRDATGKLCAIVESGGVYNGKGVENTPADGTGPTDGFFDDVTYHRVFLDGKELVLPSYFGYNQGVLDCYVPGVYLGMYWNLALEFADAQHMTLDTSKDYEYDLEKAQESGYFRYLDSIYLADAQTGCVLYDYNGEAPFSIASITKLFTYLLVKETMDTGEIREDSLYTVSDAVYALANDEDGIYCQGSSYGSLNLQQQVSVKDLLSAMLLHSSNESALALAELVCGSQEAFVIQMNVRAGELGLESAVFYNPHGLPVFTREAATAKVQNVMTAQDMFLFTQYLLQHHREHLLSITNQRQAELPTFAPNLQGETAIARNTNVLIYNLAGCLGLKTGTTNRSGASLVSVLPVTDAAGQTHDLVLVLFGAEDNFERFEKSAWLLEYAKAYYGDHSFPEPEPIVQTQPETQPTQAPTQVTQPMEVPPVKYPEDGRAYLGIGIAAVAGFLAGLLIRKRKQ